jgi:hypothetical protein
MVHIIVLFLKIKLASQENKLKRVKNKTVQFYRLLEFHFKNYKLLFGTVLYIIIIGYSVFNCTLSDKKLVLLFF